MGEYKKQHYVPQTYLRRFTIDGKRLYVFDKLQQDPARRVRRGKVRNIAHENDFYDIPDEVLKPEVRPGHDRKMIEKLLGRFDAEMGSAIEHLVATAGSGPIDPTRRALLARALGVQALRTRDVCDTVLEVSRQTLEAFCRDLTERNFPGRGNLAPRVEVKPEYIPVYHARLILQSGIEMVGRAFFNFTWTVGVNRTRQPLYTSDQPVVRFAHFDVPELSYEGFASPGIEVAFPLGPEHLLLMRDVRAPGEERANDGSVEELTEERVEFYNGLQVKQSRRQIYCRDDAFEQAADMCAADPELSAPSGQKVSVKIVPTDDPLRSLIVTNVRATRRKR